MPKLIDALELRKQWDDPAIGPERVVSWVRESFEGGRRGEAGCLHSHHFSLRDLFEDLVPDGHRLLRAMGRGISLLEDVTAVDTSAFSAITGQLVFNELLRGYENPNLIWNELCKTVSTTFLWGEKIPGIAGLGDVAEVIKEAGEYPTVGTSQEFIETQALEKRGFAVPVTREAILSDRTGMLIDRCNKTTEFLAINLEKRAVDLATGQTNNYKRNGTSTNTYLTAGAYVNTLASNPLTNEWKAIQAADLLFDALNDPNTGEPIIVNHDTLLVPTALAQDAERIRTATSVQTVDNQANSVTVRTTSGNPLGMKGRAGIRQVLTSPYVKRRTSSATQWFYGDFPRAFAKMTAWEIESDQLGKGSAFDFWRDIPMVFKGSVMDRMQVVEPRAVTKNHT